MDHFLRMPEFGTSKQIYNYRPLGTPSYAIDRPTEDRRLHAYMLLAQIPGVARDSIKSEGVREIK
jgi:hypothetical protein